MEIKNLIFDLGGVILDLSVEKTIERFSILSGLPVDRVASLFKNSAGFLKFERGEFTDQEFRSFVRGLYDIQVEDDKLDQCWNAMLLGVPSDKLDLLKKLKAKYKTFLLSNTNTIHLEYINSVVLPAIDGVSTLDNYFHRSYYSHLLGKRKPEPGIFLQVLEENGLKAEESLFLDDNLENIEGAKAVGLQTAFVNTADFILRYFHE